MELNNRVEQLENEMKILKSEIQAVLLDLRESYLAGENPFDPGSMVNILSPSVKTSKITAEGDVIKEEPVGETGIDEKLKSAAAQAVEEVKKARRSEIITEPQIRRAGEEPALGMVTALIHWVIESTKQLGQEGTKAVVEISELMGNVSPEIKAILFKLLSLSPSGQPGEITTERFLSSLLKLTEMTGKCTTAEAALISMILEQRQN
jgi:hypothetical protein